MRVNDVKNQLTETRVVSKVERENHGLIRNPIMIDSIWEKRAILSRTIEDYSVNKVL